MSSANSHTLALLLVLILTVVFSITSLALLLYRRHRRHRAVAHSQARDAHVGTADLEAKLLCSPADTLSPSLDQERPPEVPVPSGPPHAQWRSSLLTCLSLFHPRSKDTGAVLDDLEAAHADKDATNGLRTFEEFVHPQSARPTQVDIACTYGSSWSLVSVTLGSPVLASGQLPCSRDVASMCSVESSIGGTPILSSSSSTSSLESAALALSGECSVVELETTSPRVPVSSSLYSTKRLSLPFCEAWIEQLPVLVIAGLGRGPLGRPSSVVGLHREVGLGFARGIGLGLVTASGGSCSPGPTSPSPYSSVQDLSIFADAEDDFSPSSLSCGSSSGTVLAGSLSDLDEDDVDMASTGCAARDSIKRLSDLFDALSVSFSASSLQLSDHKRFSVLDAYDESDYDESDGDDDSLERLEDVIVRIGRSRREVFVYAA